LFASLLPIVAYRKLSILKDLLEGRLPGVKRPAGMGNWSESGVEKIKMRFGYTLLLEVVSELVLALSFSQAAAFGEPLARDEPGWHKLAAEFQHLFPSEINS
jgi:hypothetical protein